MFDLSTLKSLNEIAAAKPASTATVGVSAHCGHLADGSGIQKHSCDSLYPMTVRAIGRGGVIYLQAFDAVSGWAGALYSTAGGWSEAHAKAMADCEVVSCWRR